MAAPKKGPDGTLPYGSQPWEFIPEDHLTLPQKSFGEIYNKLRQLAEDNRQEKPQDRHAYALYPDELEALMTGLSNLIEENQKLLEIAKNQSPFAILTEDYLNQILKGTKK